MKKLIKKMWNVVDYAIEGGIVTVICLFAALGLLCFALVLAKYFEWFDL